VVLCLLIGLSFYLLFFSKVFLVNNIEVFGNKEIPKEKILELIYNYLNKPVLTNWFKPYSNIFFVNLDNLKADILNSFLLVSDIDIYKSLLNRKIEIKIIERRGEGILCLEKNNKCFYFDKEGKLFKESLGFDLPLIVEDGRNKNFDLGSKFDDREILTKIIKTRNILGQLELTDLDEFYIPSGSFSDFWVKTNEGWYIYLNKEADLVNQLIGLRKLLDEKITQEGRKKLEYIDLRVNNRVYYK